MTVRLLVNGRIGEIVLHCRRVCATAQSGPWINATIYAAPASGRFVRNSVIRATKLAEGATNGRFRRCGAACFSIQLCRTICCVRTVGNRGMSALGSEQTSESFCRMTALWGNPDLSPKAHRRRCWSSPPVRFGQNRPIDRQKLTVCVINARRWRQMIWVTRVGSYSHGD